MTAKKKNDSSKNSGYNTTAVKTRKVTFPGRCAFKRANPDTYGSELTPIFLKKKTTQNNTTSYA